MPLAIIAFRTSSRLLFIITFSAIQRRQSSSTRGVASSGASAGPSGSSSAHRCAAEGPPSECRSCVLSDACGWCMVRLVAYLGCDWDGPVAGPRTRGRRHLRCGRRARAELDPWRPDLRHVVGGGLPPHRVATLEIVLLPVVRPDGPLGLLLVEPPAGLVPLLVRPADLRVFGQPLVSDQGTLEIRARVARERDCLEQRLA